MVPVPRLQTVGVSHCPGASRWDRAPRQEEGAEDWVIAQLHVPPSCAQTDTSLHRPTQPSPAGSLPRGVSARGGGLRGEGWRGRWGACGLGAGGHGHPHHRDAPEETAGEVTHNPALREGECGLVLEGLAWCPRCLGGPRAVGFYGTPIACILVGSSP